MTVPAQLIPDFEDAWRPDWPLDVRRALSPHRRGTADPTLRYAEDGVWRTTTTPCGPATVRITVAAGQVRVAAWGPGAGWAGPLVPCWLGSEDRVDGFPADGHPLVADLHRRSTWLRLGRTGRVWDALLPAVLEQKVTGIEAHRTWRELLRLAGEPAPGPAPDGMRVPPSAARVLAVTDWEWHRCGLDGARRRALRAAATVADRLEAVDGCDSPTLQRRMRTVPGIGVWTAAEVVQRALGCPDTVSYGDYHLKNLVGWSLAGRKCDDDQMMELLEPFRGHRQRVVRLLEVGGTRPPKRGPRMAPTDHRAL
ncbi:DNA-3-methyladenine glycosylase 2 family protein [Modestobacter sp. I12A-02628]|uniref:DNA-3-methyladenine glycosylase 2 family protein n=1 Tax=Goekera deserti TaxID=2497753 RepID=A0A7K3WAN1_9ACTN|nr:DNA-3-methyladenine glycosylase 2 family protein [Goekera deserti]MPQ99783.1 DNA-3-methyladenine glycosylase 2 family protein [Goekera deserti]NDI49939.1 DNA-3-methyladenine glycosylase 2 family protein [Goekera deserti]NEL52583.1 DNA-3-methyladenine glycosylase 2 family protein [Goekera deserti]